MNNTLTRKLLTRCCRLLSGLAILLLLHSCSTENALIKNGKSDYKIFISGSALKPEHYAAAELQKYLHKISGYTMEIVHETKPGDKLIHIGFSGAPESLLKDLKPADFGKEEYIIRSDGNNLLIAGGGTRGTLYGVLGYLSDYLGCRWYTREVVKTPEQTTITLSKIEDRQKPALEYREAWYHEAYDTQWALHNRLNPSTKPIPDSLGGSYITYPFVHTFNNLLPPVEYFGTHPEYYSEIAGQRKDSQLCLTNPEVLKLSIKKVFQWIKEHPEANVFSIDQNDGEGYCECKNCKEIDDKEGSHSGTLLTFVNQIADTVGKVYPEIKLQTLAYAYTEIPPKTIRPADNVTIRLCHYNYCSAHPIQGCNHHKPFRDRLDQWKAISKRITVWDYFTDFAHYLMPFPNFEAVKQDVKFYADQGVIGLFAQGNNVPDNGGGEFSELRAWVFSQLMWNPDQDGQVLIDEFVNQVYGEGGKYIGAYIKLLHDQVKPDSVYFSIWSQPTEVSYLNPETIHQADSLFAQAIRATSKDTATAARVELAYLPVLYSKLYFYSIGGTAYLAGKDMPEAFARFNRIIKKHRIKAIGDVPQTYGNLDKFLEKIEAATTFTFYNDWLITGPFDNEDQKGLGTAYGPEKAFNASQSFIGKGGSKVTWRKHEDKTSGYVDFSKLFTPSENVVAYARRTIHLPEAKTMKFGVGSNDGIRVWINGKLVLNRPVSRKAEPNQDMVTAPMNKGENTILVKVDQLKRGWGFYLTEQAGI